MFEHWNAFIAQKLLYAKARAETMSRFRILDFFLHSSFSVALEDWSSGTFEYLFDPIIIAFTCGMLILAFFILGEAGVFYYNDCLFISGAY